MIKSYQQLTVWQKSMKLVVKIYRLTSSFPKEEIYGLTAQMRRAAISIPSNIAEGYARKHRREYIQFLRTAFGSGAELETQVIIAKNLKLAQGEEFRAAERLLSEVMKMLNKMVASLNPKP